MISKYMHKKSFRERVPMYDVQQKLQDTNEIFKLFNTGHCLIYPNFYAKPRFSKGYSKDIYF